MNAPCYQHDSFDSTCSSCRSMNGLPELKPRKHLVLRKVAEGRIESAEEYRKRIARERGESE